jgi:tetratricopeptide (TPR) repeat protein
LPAKVFLSSGVEGDSAFRFAETLKRRNYTGLELDYARLQGTWHFMVGAEGLTRGLVSVFNKRSIAEILLETVVEKGIESAISQHQTLRRDEPDRYDFSEAELGRLSFLLLDMDRAEDAVQVLKLSVEAYSQSFKPYYHLAVVYREMGERELAIVNYRKSLELNPENAPAAVALKKLLGDHN